MVTVTVSVSVLSGWGMVRYSLELQLHSVSISPHCWVVNGSTRWAYTRACIAALPFYFGMMIDWLVDWIELNWIAEQTFLMNLTCLIEKFRKLCWLPTSSFTDNHKWFWFLYGFNYVPFVFVDWETTCASMIMMCCGSCHLVWPQIDLIPSLCVVVCF